MEDWDDVHAIMIFVAMGLLLAFKQFCKLSSSSASFKQFCKLSASSVGDASRVGFNCEQEAFQPVLGGGRHVLAT